MRLLLDTHAFLWWVDDDPQLSLQARDQIVDEGIARTHCVPYRSRRVLVGTSVRSHLDIEDYERI